MNRKVCLLVTAGLLCSRGLLAGEPVSDFTGQEMVVTATKTENKRKDVPNAVIVIDRKEVEASAAGNLGELLANRTGIDLGSYGNYGGAAQEIHIRGMNADGTQVFVNGVSMNSLSLGTADVSKIPLADIEKIEIVKGSGSLLYGSGASGGVINIFTKEPDRNKMNFEITSEYGTQGTYGISMTQGMALARNLSYLLTLGENGTDGFRHNSDLDGKNASLKLNYRKSDKLHIALSGDYIDRKYGMPGVLPPEGTLPYFIGGVAYYDDEAASLLNRHEDKDGHAGLHISGKPSEKVLYNFRTYYSYSRSYNYYRDISGYYSANTWVTNQVEGLEGNLTFKPFQGGEIIIGGEYRHYDYENRQTPLDDNFSQFDDRYDLHSGALYTELQYRPSRYLKFLSGIRLEDNSMFATEYVYRYGLVVNPAGKTTVKFNSGSHFKAPTMNDLFWPDDGFTKGNTSLSPETGWHTDVTLEQELPGKIFLTAGYFHWNIKDKIAWAEDPSQTNIYGTNYWIPTNLDSYNADGMELGAKAALSDHVSLALDYTLLYAVEEKAGTAERQSLYTPRHQFKGQLTYSDSHGLTISPVLTFMGRRPYYTGSNTGSAPSRYIGSYWLLDLKASKRLNDHFSFSASANNLFDSSYVTRLEYFYDASYHSALCSYPGAGRSLLFSLTYRY